MKTHVAIRRFCVLGLTTLLASCTAMHSGNTSYGVSLGEIVKMPPEQATAAVSNWTIMTYDPGTFYCLPVGKYSSCTSTPGHGTQIEYFAPEGKAYLWYPKNPRAVRSFWRLARNGDTYSICFKYPSRSYNPVTREHGGRWECRLLAMLVSRITESRRGDIFRLVSGRLPFPLAAGETTFDTLLRQWGKAPAPSTG